MNIIKFFSIFIFYMMLFGLGGLFVPNAFQVLDYTTYICVIFVSIGLTIWTLGLIETF